MKNRSISALSILFLALAAPPASAQNHVWTRQLGTSSSDELHATAPDGLGGVYVSGFTYGDLGGLNAGNSDAWLARYDCLGNQTWVRQFGTISWDEALAAASDGSGGVFVGGYTNGSLGAQNAGYYDAWLAHYDGAATQSWIRQLGTAGYDFLYAATPDAAGGVYVGGSTWGSLGDPNVGNRDAWLARYDTSGSRIWIHQFGTSASDELRAAAPDGSGGVYLSGTTEGDLSGPNAGQSDVWIARHDSAGNQVWILQLGTSGTDSAYATASDGSGGVFVGGYSWGSIGGQQAGTGDAWLAYYDGAGNQIWIRQLGTSSEDVAWAAAPDGSGGVHISGDTSGSLGGPSAGGDDAWMARYDSSGSQTWVRNIGTSSGDHLRAAAPDGSSGVFLGGYTNGNLGGQSAGFSDAWLAYYDSSVIVPYCTGSFTSTFCVPSISGTGRPSASVSSGFTVSVNAADGQRQALFFYGIDNTGFTPVRWAGGGFLCVKQPLQRTPMQSTGGTAGSCDGVLSLDWNTYIAGNPIALGNPFVGGETIWAQAWLRDPPSAKTSAISNALQFNVNP